MTQINPKYIELIERIKEKHPELLGIIEELRKWCLIEDNYYGYYWEIVINYWHKVMPVRFANRLWEMFTNDINLDDWYKIIWQLDLYILGRALPNDFYILKWTIRNAHRWEFLKLPHW